MIFENWVSKSKLLNSIFKYNVLHEILKESTFIIYYLRTVFLVWKAVSWFVLNEPQPIRMMKRFFSHVRKPFRPMSASSSLYLHTCMRMRSRLAKFFWKCWLFLLVKIYLEFKLDKLGNFPCLQRFSYENQNIAMFLKNEYASKRHGGYTTTKTAM